MDWSWRTKLLEEWISCAVLLDEAPLGAVGSTHHFDSTHSAIAEVIFASSEWRLANFSVNHIFCARLTPGCNRTRSTVPQPLFTRTGLPKAIATTHLRRSSALESFFILLFTARTVSDLIVLRDGRTLTVLERGAGHMADLGATPPTLTGLASSRGAAGRRGTFLPFAALTWPGLARVRPNHRLA